MSKFIPLITWERRPMRLGSAVLVAKVGKVPVGSVGFAVGARSEPEAWNYDCRLPGLKRELASGQRPTEQAAQSMLKALIENWFGLVQREEL